MVSAIAGSDGLGKSVLGAALGLDEEVQQWSDDGVSWVTLGPNPDSQYLLGDWIQALDKLQEIYLVTTLD